jgi:hypothetical protein
LLPDNIGDPMELLDYLGPSGDSSSNGDSNVNSNNDDILSLFDT